MLYFQSLEWRASYGADTILEDWDPPEVLKNYYPGGIFGVDKEGHPILYQLSKDFDPKGRVKAGLRSLMSYFLRSFFSCFPP